MISLLNLPNELIEKILSYASYDEVSRLRLVCKKFDNAAQHVLNHGFYKVEKFHSQCLRKVKTQLPRRESERRKHPLARHCDILTAVETRLSLLAMTYMKYVESNYCCFIPGKVLDEIFKVVRYVSKEKSPSQAHEVLQELRDISSMAMEYFDENIAPAFKKDKAAGPKLAVTTYGEFSGSLQVNVSQAQRTNDAASQIYKLIHHSKHLQKKHNALKKEFRTQQQKVLEQKRLTSELERKVTAQSAKIDEQEAKLEELNRKCVDNKRVLSAIAEIVKFRVDSDESVNLDVPKRSKKSQLSAGLKRKQYSPHNMTTRMKKARLGQDAS